MAKSSSNHKTEHAAKRKAFTMRNKGYNAYIGQNSNGKWRCWWHKRPENKGGW
jgi:ABC-type antimicrobial peptide transport system ATPase subunit